jgi:hypothetical protein
MDSRIEATTAEVVPHAVGGVAVTGPLELVLRVGVPAGVPAVGHHYDERPARGQVPGDEVLVGAAVMRQAQHRVGASEPVAGRAGRRRGRQHACAAGAIAAAPAPADLRMSVRVGRCWLDLASWSTWRSSLMTLGRTVVVPGERPDIVDR